MATANEIIKIARAELGVKESPANSNKVKYTTSYGVITAWCVIFLWWCFKQAGASKLFYDGKKCASCSQLRNWARPKNQWVTKNYKVGDLIMFNFSGGTAPQHIGICTKVTGSTITTIDGNTGTGNEANGGKVMERTRNIRYVVGAFRPKYEASTSSSSGTAQKPKEVVNTVEITLPLLVRGSTGGYVKTLQRLLKQLNYKDSSGKLIAVDGDYGAKTEYAVKNFQRAKKLSVDGKCGKNTWEALLKG